jgi:TolB-like protein/Flp pilus assembly protein TadD
VHADWRLNGVARRLLFAPVANREGIRDDASQMVGAPGIAGGGDEEKGSRSAPSVFISYASQDATVAQEVVEALERQGLKCWIAPRDVTAGAPYAGQIIHAIDAAKASVLILSRDAAASPHVLREVERTASKRHSIVALRIDQAPLPADFEYFLSASHWLETSAGDMGRTLPKLVAAIQLALQTPAATPAGSRDSHPSAPVVSARPPKKMAMIVVAVLALGLVGLAADRWWLSHRRGGPHAEPALASIASAPAATPAAPTIPEKSVAVLPFVDMSEKKDQEYFSDGLTEELIDMLAKVPDLRVPARTSSFYFKGKQTTIADIAKALSVSHVLEGSVRKSANKLRVTAQLIRADNGYHVWSETYDRAADDIFKVQDEIAGEVVRALRVSLDAIDVLRDAPAKGMQAYDLLLQARNLFHRGTEEDCKRAVGYYKQVVQIDPNAAVAWAELSEALRCTGSDSLVMGQQVRVPALQAAKHAIAIDPKFAEAHVALAGIRYWLDWDWAAANVEYQKARELDPGNSRALSGAAGLALLRGSLSDSLRLSTQAIVRDPLNQNAFFRLAVIYSAMGQFEDSAAAARKALELRPNWPGLNAGLSQILLALGQQEAALAEIDRETDPGFRAYALARTYIVLGHRVDADLALSSFEKTYASEQPYNIATLHALRGELDQAFSWLNRAYQQRDSAIVAFPPFTVDPDVKNLRGDPRYKVFLRKMNLPEHPGRDAPSPP